jgi:hypothetical protein
MQKYVTPIVVCLLLTMSDGLTSVLLAKVDVTNGDFSEEGFFLDPTWGQFYHDIPWWGELNEDVTWDDMLIDTSAGAFNDEDFTAGLAGWRGFPSGYIYQEIGTPDGASQLRVTGINFWRDNGQMQYDDLVVELYSLPGGHSFAFEEFGNDIAQEGELVDTQRVIPAPEAQGESVPFDELFNLAGLAASDRLFLRFSAGVNPDLPGRDVWAYVDNVTVALVGGAGRQLQAGDADQDLDFDQLDLVRVQIAAKYLTGLAATWGEGDWNGAPGGQPGSPPAGNGFFDQLDIVAALGPGHYLRGPYAALANPNGVRGDGQASITYHAGTGEVAVDAPAGISLTSVNIDSAASIFTGAAAQNLGGSFDNDADNNIFKATFGSSFGSISFGSVAQPGLSKEFVLNDLTVVGSLAGGGALGDVDLIYVPEPSTLVLVSAGLMAVVAYVGAKGRKGRKGQKGRKEERRFVTG